MATARIDRMLRELDCDPSHQFFSTLFGLVGLARQTQKAQDAEDSAIALSMLRSALAG